MRNGYQVYTIRMQIVYSLYVLYVARCSIFYTRGRLARARAELSGLSRIPTDADEF